MMSVVRAALATLSWRWPNESTLKNSIGSRENARRALQMKRKYTRVLLFYASKKQ